MAIAFEELLELTEAFKKCCSNSERIQLLDNHPRVREWLERVSVLKKEILDFALEELLILKSLVFLDEQKEVLSFSESSLEKIYSLLALLTPIEAFYKEIGGIIGYQCALFSHLEAMHTAPIQENLKLYHPPPGIDISGKNDLVSTYVLEGIVSLPFLAEMYPVGGAADRLHFCDPSSGVPLPAAKMPFCGRTLLEGLIRDLQAREYLYYKLFGEQITTPIVMMTSPEKENHSHVIQLCESCGWFGRPKDSFQIFCQPVVPAIDRKGQWCVNPEGALLMKPGGHGVIWKAAKTEGVFDWLESLGRKKILVRQVNNPIAGVDDGLLSFCGVGFREDKLFGFASCPRQVGSAEGVNVLIETRGLASTSFCLTNIEYCDFAKFGIKDAPVDSMIQHNGHTDVSSTLEYSRFPSNTNILFADIAAVKKAVSQCPIPGMLVNFKTVSYFDAAGALQQQEFARLESTMQNIADCFQQSKETLLSTFLTYNHRHKTISTTKKMYKEGGSLLETPEGSFYDVLLNAYDLLTNYCGMQLPSMPQRDAYYHRQPPFLLTYHPALGPLFSVIGQKIRRGRLNPCSELRLEIAEVDIENLTLSGSLQVIAERVITEKVGEKMEYSDRVGSVRLYNVSVVNRGIDLDAGSVYWKDEIYRHEECTIVIRGNGEFLARDVVLRGRMRIEVEEGFRLIAYEERGALKFRKEPLLDGGKKWTYHLGDKGEILLK